jgi:hypothetical protein
MSTRAGVLDLIRMSLIFFNDPQGAPSQMYSISAAARENDSLARVGLKQVFNLLHKFRI